MTTMIIRPGKTAGQHVPYAVGMFDPSDDSYIINQMGGRSPFGDYLCGLGSSYAVDVLPNGFGRSWYAGSEITLPDGLGKAWYMRDRESGNVWSAFFSPSCEKADEYELRYFPGQVCVYSLKNKIASKLTIATAAEGSFEVWRVELENRSAKDRTIEFTTYVQPYVRSALEAKYLAKERSLVMRVPLEEIAVGQGARELSFFHSSTLTPIRYQSSKSDFVGDGRTLRNPQHLEREESTGADGPVRDAVMSMTVEIELPIEGRAELGFCFGVAESAERALKVAKSLAKTEDVAAAVDESGNRWKEVCSSLRVESSDRAFDALVNTWLPYEAYAAWLRERNASSGVDPSRLADVLRRVYPVCATVPEVCRDSLLSFAGGLSLVAAHTPDTGSLVELSPKELLWLPLTAARYVAETGDKEVLEMSISLTQGPSLTLREHCERILGMCASPEKSSDSAAELLLESVIREWSLLVEDTTLVDRGADPASRRLAETGQPSERRVLPRRVRYLQSISPFLSGNDVSESIGAYSDESESATGEARAACCVYAALVERTLGLTATAQGLVLNPRLPDSWCECNIVRRFRGDTYDIHIERPIGHRGKGMSIVIDGEPVLGNMLPWSGGGKEHRVDVVLG